MKALLIYSGGLDSTTLLHELRSDIHLAVSFDYGAKHNAQELACARAQCAKLDLEQLVIPLDFMGKHFQSALLVGGGDIPEGRYDTPNMRQTVVPFRNGIMLAVAAGLAESRGLDTLLIANHSGDHAIYPDCRPDFVEAFSRATKAGTYNGVVVHSPYCQLTKRDIALRGRELGVDYAETWSCYKGGRQHCGRCATCLERREALAGFDPTAYDA